MQMNPVVVELVIIILIKTQKNQSPNNCKILSKQIYPIDPSM